METHKMSGWFVLKFIKINTSNFSNFFFKFLYISVLVIVHNAVYNQNVYYYYIYHSIQLIIV